ncbi:glycosyltransferase family 4 protein [Clostridiaceae bacterium]|nr:glycosyltransferase family 4 protein [Clostridiaceae bacterium]
MKIAILINSLQGGGAERVAATLANQFSRMGNEVMIWLFNPEGRAYRIEETVSLHVLQAESEKRLIRIVKRALSCRKEAVCEKPDVLLAFTITNIPYAFAAKTGHRTAVFGLERANPECHKGLLWAFVRLLSPLCDGFIFQTEGAKNCYPHTTGKKAAVIKNPLSIVYERCIPAERSAFKICSAGRLHSDKDFETLISAFALYRKDGGKGTLDIFGDGIKRGELEQMAESLGADGCIRFMGFTENLQEKLCEYDLFVFSSRSEGMPNALLEAMAVGLPCISTDCDFGPREFIRSGENGILVPVGDAKKMAEAMRWAQENGAMRERMAKEAKKIHAELSAEKIARAYLDYMNQTLYGRAEK